MKFWLLLAFLVFTHATDSSDGKVVTVTDVDKGEEPKNDQMEDNLDYVSKKAGEGHVDEVNAAVSQTQIQYCKDAMEVSTRKVALKAAIVNGVEKCLGIANKGPDTAVCAEVESAENRQEQGQCKSCRYASTGMHGANNDIPTCAPKADLDDTAPDHFCTTSNGGLGVMDLNNAEGGGCVYKEQFVKPYTDMMTRLKTEGKMTEVSVGQTSSSDNVDPNDLRLPCGTYNIIMKDFDPDGYFTCNDLIEKYIKSGDCPGCFGHNGYADIYCYVDRSKGVNGYWNDDEPTGRCDCEEGLTLGTDGKCHTFHCTETTSGPGCLECAKPLTRNYECARCNSGYILVNGDCLENICTEDPNEWEWQGCQECRVQESRRHPNDCLTCAHGYHFMHEQRNLPNQTHAADSYSSGSLVIQGEETGYCFPYNCIAGGNLCNVDPMTAFQAGHPVDKDQRSVNITKVLITDHNDPNMDPSVPRLTDETLKFRDHCRSCVPQQMRTKEDHCETCNPGYYLDEMHHTCRKKTCGAPHFRRNSVSCTMDNLAMLPHSTPCTHCLDNSNECCEMVPEVMTCGAQNVFCHMGTHKVDYFTTDCSADGCVNLSELCCEKKTCDNQQVACHPGQIREAGDKECTTCIHADTDCCTNQSDTCGLHDVKCGHGQTYKGADTSCSDCTNGSLDCCTPVATTCRNQNVFCHLGTYKPDEENSLGEMVPLGCTQCEHYGEECCEDPTCENQRVPCSPGRKRIPEGKCENPGDCVMDSETCCEPLPEIEKTCGNQHVKCEPRMYKNHATPCDTGEVDNNCDDYGLTCCEEKTCQNQGVGCSILQAPMPDGTTCEACADGGNECCSDHKTCGLMGVQCKPGFYLPPTKKCDDCEHHGAECCATVEKTCMNQGTICLPGTYMPMGTDCEDCSHYGKACCNDSTCGNQQVACSPGRERASDDTVCGDECYHDSDKCCAKPDKTCANQHVKCRDGHYLSGQNDIVCDDDCTNYGSTCCEVFQKTCGNQNVVCSSDQTYAPPTEHCTDCANNAQPCCLPVTKTCANQNVVCRPGHYEDLIGVGDGIACGDCLNDSTPCCKPLVKTCGNQNVVCGADQTYMPPNEVCGSECVNHGEKCCTDVAKTCSNQRVGCKEGHYADGYGGEPGILCETAGCRPNTEPCCKPHQNTCGNMNVKCGANQKPENPNTTCDGDQCTHGSSRCCMDVDQTCANQSVVCRPGHYKADPDTIKCGDTGCKNDSQPCCEDFVKTCGNQNVQCLVGQNPLNPDETCTQCTAGDPKCCTDIEATCKNQNIICHPGGYKANQGQIKCDGKCEHHGDHCCDDVQKTCGNQNVDCNCGQSYAPPGTHCDDCASGATPCCVDDKHTCLNQRVMCAPGHYADDYMTADCPEDSTCMHDAMPCCTPYPKTCGNQNVKCGKNQVPNNPSTPCDGTDCDNNSSVCCTDVAATCDNQGVVCRPGHYRRDYVGRECLAENSLGDLVNFCYNDQAHCCQVYQKTCQNQNVRCGYGLLRRKQPDSGEVTCEDCVDYGKDCCEEVTKTCGNSGVSCRQDLFLPVDTTCDTCDAEQCCKDIPVTCASAKYPCKKGHYLTGDRVCGEKGCSDEDCCHPVETTCGNQHVQCHPGHYKEGLADLKCSTCTHYGSDCCNSVTCSSAGVTCDAKYYREASDFSSKTCDGEGEGCVIADDKAPCCEPRGVQAKAPTCRNKYGVDDADKKLFPFLVNFEGKTVTCDVSQGYYYRMGTDGKVVDDVCTGSSEDNHNGCGNNDPHCCWRKTCTASLDFVSPLYNDGSGLDQDGESEVSCPDGTTLKDNSQYIVCHGDCISDCCEPNETCSSARVACSHGYERRSGWDQLECVVNGKDDCVENSSTCCVRTTCLNVQCDSSKYTPNVNALCLDCMADGEECCTPIVVKDTCLNQRVHCGYGFYKRADYSSDEKTCDKCLDDGDECCLPKTCTARGVGGDMVTCSGDFEDRDDKDRKPCWNCLDNGAECCKAKIPEKTCLNQDTECTFGYFHKDIGKDCKDCTTNGEDCCTQRTCANPDGSMTSVGCGSTQIAKKGDTPCTLCMANSSECCTEQETCWSAQVVCPIERYHKHPNTVCGDNCDVEHCCALKTCENQGVCCNASLGFSAKDNLDQIECTDCADNCEECCSHDTPTCSSAKVGCGYGMHRKPGTDDTPCDTCALNDEECCVPKTCGAEEGIDSAVDCGVDHDYLGDNVPCHFCNKAECCRPKAPTPTCKSEGVVCGAGLKFEPQKDDGSCDSCVQNDSACCVATTCENFDCGTGFLGVGARSCVLCEHHECCRKVQTCASAGVGCGFGHRPYGDQSQDCKTCQMNDGACCEKTTCANTNFQCPSGFVKDETTKGCAFCETSECCIPVVVDKTCSNTPVVCGHGLTKIPGSEDEECGSCEMNHPKCCAKSKCTEDICNSMEGFHRKMTVTNCGICSVEECCSPDVPKNTCANQRVGCGFGMKYKPNPELNGCTDCKLNEDDCCDPKKCSEDGPVCTQLTKDGLAFTPLAEDRTCTVCDAQQCCVPPVIQKTCVNQRVECSGEHRNNANYNDPVAGTCDTCLPNDLACCERKTCGNSDVTCNSDLFTEVEGFADKPCMVCASNALECCEPKLCGHHFLDMGETCPEETFTTNPRNQPCVNCDRNECCTEIEVPTLKCTEILIPNGQAFYSEPSGPGSARTKGSVLRVECDLGFKSQGAEYLYSDNLMSPDQSPDVDHPVCDPVLLEEWTEGRVEVYSPTTSGWNRAPPVCRPVSCPLLTVQSLFTPDASEKWGQPIGKVVYRDAQMDEVPMRGSGYGPRDYAAEADVVCNEGWIRVPNVCVEEAESTEGGEAVTNTLEWGLKGYWKFEENTMDNSPHCKSSRGEGDDGLGSCNDGTFNGAEVYTDGVEMDNEDANKSLVYDGTSHYVEVHDETNLNWSGRNPNELNLETDQWTASLWINMADDQLERDSYLFARYTDEFKEVVTIKLNNGIVGVIYNGNREDPRAQKQLKVGGWINILARCTQQTIDLFVDGVLVGSHHFPREEAIMDTAFGHVFIGADRESDRAGTVNQYFHGSIDEVRYYTRGLTDQEIVCIAQKKAVCPRGHFYAKPYNTQGCNRESEEIATYQDCVDAVTELLQDSVLGNSLNGGTRFNKRIEDKQSKAATDTPTKCSYREEDSQLMWNPNPTGRAHTSLAPICRRTPTGDDLKTVGCLPKCLENGMWSVALPTCEKDWCNPIFEEWGCCEHREEEMERDYWLNHHNQRNPKCPIGYGDCNNDDECTKENGVRGLCSQRRDLDNVDLCIIDVDPCDCYDLIGATGAMCRVWTAVGGDFETATNTHIASRMFMGGMLLALGTFTGLYLCRGQKGEEHRYLLEEEL